MAISDQLAEAASWRWRKLPPPPGKPFETVGYEASTPKGVARIVRAVGKNGKPAKDRWVLRLGDHEVDLGKRASFDHGDAALAKLLGEDRELLTELAGNQIDKKWVTGVRRWWATEVGTAKTYPGRVDKVAFLDGPAAMSAGKAALAAIERLSASLAQLRDDLFINKGFWQPADTHISKDERRWGGTPRVWREKVTSEVEGARERVWDARGRIDTWIRVVDPKTPEWFGRGAYPDVFKDETGWNRLIRTFGTLVDEAADDITKMLDRLLRFLSKMAGKSGKSGQPWELGSEILPDVVDAAGVKVIFDPLPSPTRAAQMDMDGWTPPTNRKIYVDELVKTKALLRKRGLGFLWYGRFHVRPKGTAPANHLGPGLNVAANYDIRGDFVNIFTTPRHLAHVVAHELGHRLWFRFLTPAQRAGFGSHFGKVKATSSYGSINTEEDFAEVFEAYIDGRDLTRDQIERFKAFTQGKWKMEHSSQLESALDDEPLSEMTADEVRQLKQKVFSDLDSSGLSGTLASALSEMSAKEVRKALRKKGCEELRQKGSHLQIKCDDKVPAIGGPCHTTIPMHGGDIKKGTMHGIEKSVEPCIGTIR